MRTSTLATLSGAGLEARTAATQDHSGRQRKVFVYENSFRVGDGNKQPGRSRAHRESLQGSWPGNGQRLDGPTPKRALGSAARGVGGDHEHGRPLDLRITPPD
jgi:hypothetical protein